MKLVASMIVRDERDRYQPALSKHLLEFCDEIRIMDDASKDGTGQALEQLDWRVHVQGILGHSTWDNWGEGIARQGLLAWTLASDPTHVLAIDADEVVLAGTELRQCIERNPDADCFLASMVEVWLRRSDQDWQARIDGGWAPHDFPLVWKVPAHLGDGWQIREDRLASGRVPEIIDLLAQTGDAVHTGCTVYHLGWSNPYERKRRADRYAAIDGGRFHNSRHLASILEPPELATIAARPDML